MKWSRIIAFVEPLRGVQAGTRAPAPAPTLGASPAIPAPGREAESEAAARLREEQAYQRGLEDGERRLGEQLLQQRSEVQQLHVGVLNSLRESVAGVLRDTEATLIDFAFEVASKVVAEMPISREMVEANIRGALAEAKDATEFFIHLHPDDLELLQRQASELLAGSAVPAPMRFLPSPEVGRGGCLVRTEFGAIDARRETRLNRLRQALEG